MIHPTPEALDITYPKTYEDLIPFLQSSHFYPSKEITIKAKKEVVTGLRLESAPIWMDNKVKRLEEILKDLPFTVNKFPNEGYILITLVKKK